MNNFHILSLGLLMAISAGFSSLPAKAGDLIPPVSEAALVDESEGQNNDGGDLETTHPMLRLTPDKSELVHLDRNAISVVVGNPSHLSVLLDTPNMLVLVPRAPGATYFTVLDEAGEVIMQRHVIVGSPKKNYVRIRRSCANGAEGCRATSVYFCPDMCHEIDVPQMGAATEAATVPTEVPAGSSASAQVPSENSDGEQTVE
jgi:Flp pilus assembly secretin CpaC